MKIEDIQLVKYDEISEEEFIDYITEWERTSEKIVPGATNRKDLNFTVMRKMWTEHESIVSENYVPETLYFLRNNKNRILGAIQFRHKLNDRLKINGGHIGYGIRPSERRNGYASIMLKKMLEIVKKKKYQKVLVTCDDDNIGSIKTIEKNHGILQDKPIYEGVLTRRYWIEL